ncbi:MAG TPA: hypothetical protein VEA59_06455 [Patescibacteria group bacterium]|nr:hypothetical protein [Patescibacteria group bacterium]
MFKFRKERLVAIKHDFTQNPPHIPVGDTIEEEIEQAERFITELNSKHVLFRTYTDEADQMVNAFIERMKKSHPDVLVKKRRYT